MTQKELNEILHKHKLWLDGDPDETRADLRGTNLRWTDLRGTNLRWTDLSGVDLSGADLRGTEERQT